MRISVRAKIPKQVEKSFDNLTNTVSETVNKDLRTLKAKTTKTVLKNKGKKKRKSNWKKAGWIALDAAMWALMLIPGVGTVAGGTYRAVRLATIAAKAGKSGGRVFRTVRNIPKVKARVKAHKKATRPPMRTRLKKVRNNLAIYGGAAGVGELTRNELEKPYYNLELVSGARATGANLRQFVRFVRAAEIKGMDQDLVNTAIERIRIYRNKPEYAEHFYALGIDPTQGSEIDLFLQADLSKSDTPTVSSNQIFGREVGLFFLSQDFKNIYNEVVVSDKQLRYIRQSAKLGEKIIGGKSKTHNWMLRALHSGPVELIASTSTDVTRAIHGAWVRSQYDKAEAMRELNEGIKAGKYIAPQRTAATR